MLHVFLVLHLLLQPPIPEPPVYPIVWSTYLDEYACKKAGETITEKLGVFWFECLTES